MVSDVFKICFLALLTSQYAESYTENQCIKACLRTAVYSSELMTRVCKECAQDPPIGFQMCYVAASHPGMPYLKMIADQCVDRVALTDNMCIKACKFDQIPTFHQICGKCILSPPISGDMCIFACDNVGKLTANLYNVCFKCSISPPVSYKLCRRACLNTRGNSYYRGICRSRMCNSWNQEFETDALY